jgi:tRNA 2-selenouridine synthase
MADYTAIGIAELLARLPEFDALIDARSPSEFAEDHLPGAINCPVLDDAERARVGTLHVQSSPFEARRLGAALVSRNIAALLEQRFAAMPREWRPLVYCWRGGSRSGALTTVMHQVGWRVRRLEGGYKAYRNAVLSELAQRPAQFAWRVIVGPTGSGKSRLLRALAEAGAQVLDLEDLAEHRGSVLGGLPSQPQPSQKLFESRVWSALRGFDPARPVFVESESRKVGDLRVPERLIECMRAAPCVSLELPQAERVRLLREEYRHFEADPEALCAQLDCLIALHGHEHVAQWQALARAGQWDEVVARLLAEHYDTAYRRSIRRNFAQLEQAQPLPVDRADPAHYAAAAAALIDASPRDRAAAPQG